MNRVYEFLKAAETYYLATVEGDQPRVRPFGTVHIFEGKLYIQTGKGKHVAKQIAANPKVELCAMKGDEWIRVAGTLVFGRTRRGAGEHARRVPLSSRDVLQSSAASTPPSTISRTPLQRFHLSRTSPYR